MGDWEEGGMATLAKYDLIMSQLTVRSQKYPIPLVYIIRVLLLSVSQMPMSAFFIQSVFIFFQNASNHRCTDSSQNTILTLKPGTDALE